MTIDKRQLCFAICRPDGGLGPGEPPCLCEAGGFGLDDVCPTRVEQADAVLALLAPGGESSAAAAAPAGGGAPAARPAGYAEEVRAVAAAILAEAGDAPAEVAGDAIARHEAAGRSPLSAACAEVARVREMRLQRGPYSRDEARVCEYLAGIAPDLGCGFDPVGFLIASHATLAARAKGRRG